MKQILRKLPAWKLLLVALVLLAIPLLAQATFAGLPVTKQAVLQSGFQATQGLQATVRHPDMTMQALHSDTSVALRTLPARITKSTTAEDNENPTILRSPSNKNVVDNMIQRALGPLAMPTPIQNFEGQYNQNGPLPPDTNGDVGRNQYVQIVNSTFQIFSKTGTSLYGPTNINTLFTGFGGPCELRNDGDPIVLYDAFADRWLLTQFTSAAPYMQCIAISTSADPTGSYYRYAFLDHNSTNTLGDYPHLGVWPDAYYMTTNEFAPSFVGDGNYAYDRTKMLVGDPTAGVVYFHGTDGGKLPSDVDGTTLPPAGSPNFIMEFYNDSPGQLAEFKFHVDFATPANSTYTGPFLISVADFNSNAPSVPEPGTTTMLDNLSDRLMYRLAYRNYGDHEALVLNHTVNASGVDGVRWYELRDPNNAAGASVFQQGTYAPTDGLYRWMGSVAMDHAGDLAVGFSAGNASVFPGLRYAGRLVGDPLGMLSQGEATLFAGTGSEDFPAAHRWGDYSAMQVDPLDDCTYWYTNMYWSVTGERNWRTRIGSFKFPSCTAQNTPTPVATVATTPTNTPGPSPTACAGAVTYTGSITNTDPTQTGRLGLGGLVSVCGTQKATPGTSDTLTRHYKSYSYTNTTGSSQCLTINISQACGNNAIQSITYLNTYNPNSITSNYLGDGGAAGPNFSYAVTLPSGQTAVIVVAEVSPNIGCSTYTLMINPCGGSPAATPSATATTGIIPTVTIIPTISLTPPAASATASSVATGQASMTSTTQPGASSTSTVQPGVSATTTVQPSASVQASATSTSTVQPTACPIQFTDVPSSGSGSTFYSFVRCLVCRGVVSGYPCGGVNPATGGAEPCDANQDGYYRPGNNVSRGQLSKIIANSAGLNSPIPTGQQSFSDVPPSSSPSSFYVYIERLASTGAIAGYPCNTTNPQTGQFLPCDNANRPYFLPTNSATRGQISKIVALAAGYQDILPTGQQTFTDVPPNSPFYQYIEELASRHIIDGYDAASGRCEAHNPPYAAPCFLYNDFTTRGQMAKIAANAFYPNCQTASPQSEAVKP